MKCPYCGSELAHYDIFGQICSNQDGKILGDIYRCPNGLKQNGSCGSEMFHLAGSFHTYCSEDGLLHEGYPCYRLFL